MNQYTICDSFVLYVCMYVYVYVCMYVCSALSWLGVDMEMDEIECILANLIFQSKIKGYLSHEKRTLIVSKADPFPSSAIIKSVNNSNSSSNGGGGVL